MARRMAKKAAATTRSREGKAKKKLHDGIKEKPLKVPRETDKVAAFEQAIDPAPLTGFNFGHPAHYQETNETGQYGIGPEPPADIRSNLARTMEGYRDQYSETNSCGDMIAHILSFRPAEDVEQFVYDMTGKAWPALNPGHRRMNCGNVIRGLVNRRDADTVDWLLSTVPR